MLERVYSALLNVQRFYLKYPTIGNNHKYGERVFAYEFYHHLRNAFNDQYLDITGEPIKGAGMLPDMLETIVPDFVIHNYARNDRNEIAIEIKVTPRVTAKEIYEDLRKLATMINGPLQYKLGIFFAGNCDLINKVNNSTMYKKDIIKTLINTPNILLWNTLPFVEGTDMSQCIQTDEIINITVNHFNN